MFPKRSLLLLLFALHHVIPSIIAHSMRQEAKIRLINKWKIDNKDYFDFNSLC